MNTSIDRILSEKVIMIVRGVQTNNLIDLAEAMWQGGIRVMECTYDASGKIPDEEVARSIGALSDHFGEKMLIGAGTVLTERQVQLTASAGGRFIISPDTNKEIIQETKRLELVSIPGALTPSEANLAHRAGADFVKLFPVSQLGAGYVKALVAPLSHIRFLAVGGVRSENLLDYLNNGACGIGIGLDGKDREAISRNDFRSIEEHCREIVNKVKSNGIY